MSWTRFSKISWISLFGKNKYVPKSIETIDGISLAPPKLKPHSPKTQMRNSASTISSQSRHAGLDSAIGQIDLIGESGEIVKSWRIRSPRCTIGSSADCSVQLLLPGVASLHATLIFGKKHTLLRSEGPTLISNRRVREWLIDHSTEIVIGQCRLVVHPSMGVLATIVHAENLIDQAARLCKDEPMADLSEKSVENTHIDQTSKAVDRPLTSIEQSEAAAAFLKLHSIEKLILSLQASLDRMHSEQGAESKNSNDSIVESVTREMDEFGKKLFTTLSDQLNSQTGSQHSLISNLADRLMQRIGTIDEQLNSQTEVQHSLMTSLAERLTDRIGAIDQHLTNQAGIQQSLISNLADRFAARIRAIDEQLNNQTGVQQSLISILADRFTDRFGAIDEQLNNQTGIHQSLISNLADRFTDRFGAIDEQLSQFTVASCQQANSLNELLIQARSEQELVEARFQEVISQRDELIEAVQVLRSEITNAYRTRDDQLYASESVCDAQYKPDSQTSDAAYHPYPTENAVVADDTTCYREQTGAEFPSNQSPATVTDDQLADSLERAQVQIKEYNQQLRSLESERDLAHQRVATLSESWQPPRATPQDFEETDQSETVEINSQFAAIEEGLEQAEASENSELPAWFRQNDQTVSDVERDATSVHEMDSPTFVEHAPNYDSFASPDLTGYSDIDYDSGKFEQNEHLDSPDQSADSSGSNLDSIAERLQRMLLDADQRRGGANPGSAPLTSRSWSQRYNKPPLTDDGYSDAVQPDQEAAEAESLRAMEPIYDGRDAEGTDDKCGSQPSESELPDSSRHLYSDQEEGDFSTESSAIRAGENEAAESAHSFSRPGSQDFSYGQLEQQEVSATVRPPQSDAKLVGRESENGESPEGEESIERYMQRLLNRVRGGTEMEALAAAKSTAAAIDAPGPILTKPRSRVAESMGLELPEIAALDPAQPIAEQMFVPRLQATEQRNDLAALRELANINARRAISRSDIRRTNSAFCVKLGITALAVSSAAALFLINGFALNAPFAGMLAAIVVSVLWGYDCIHHFQRLKNVGGMNQVSAEETAAGQTIRVSSNTDSGWHPSST